MEKSLFDAPKPVFGSLDSNQLNCLQIGIQKFAEYTYLVGYKDTRDDQIWKPPDLFPSDKWNYYGVDGDPACILDWNNKCIPNTKWINVFLDTQSGIVNVNSIPDSLNFYSAEFRNLFVGKLTLSQLISNLNITELEILIMDIEGYEQKVLHEYDWNIKPKYLIIETHTEDIKNALMGLFILHGYQEIEQRLTNAGQTTELIYQRG